MLVETMENLQYKVVVNHEEQYALWPSGRGNASGWEDTGMAGVRAECLAYIREKWTDMRPLSLRKMVRNYTPVPTELHMGQRAYA